MITLRHRNAGATLRGALYGLAMGGMTLSMPVVGASAEMVDRIEVRGIERVEAETVKSYLSVEERKPFTPLDVRKSITALYDTGFFKDVALEQEGGTLIVRLVENPMVSEVTFEGFDAFSKDDLTKLIQMKARSIYNRAKGERDLAALRQAYRIKGLFLAEIDMVIKPLEQNRIKVIYRIKEGEKSKVQMVRMVGNGAFSEKELAKKLMIQPAGFFSWFTDDDTYDREKLLSDQEQLRNFYMDNGYTRVRVDSSVAELTPDRRAFVITHTIHEGDRYTFGQIKIISDFNETPEKKLYEQLQMVEGRWFSREDLRQSVEKLTDLVGDFGYANLDVRPETKINDETKVVDVTFHIAKGRRVYLNRIEVVGNSRTRDEVIRRELRSAEGDRFASSRIRRSKERLKALNFFENVEITTPPSSDPDRVNVRVQVEEKATGAFTIGAGYSSYDNLIGTASVSQNNFLGKGQRVALSFSLSSRTTEFDLSLTDPYFGNGISAGIDLYDRKVDRQAISGYMMKTYGTAFRLGFPLAEHVSDSPSYSIAHVDVKNVQPTASLAIREQAARSPYLQSMVSNVLGWDDLDNPLLPTKGSRQRLITDYAGVGGDVHFARGLVDMSSYYSLMHKDELVAHLRGRVGAIQGLQGEEIPIFERFYLGGSNSVRGFDNGGIGPRTTLGEFYGGTHFENASGELIFPFMGLGDKGVRGLVFLDVGYVGTFKPAPGVIQPKTPSVGAGTGVDWHSPFGPLRFNLGWPVVKNSGDHTRFFDFSIGTAL